MIFVQVTPKWCVLHGCKVVSRLIINFTPFTRWVPTIYKWGYNSYTVNGLINWYLGLCITSKGPPCIYNIYIYIPFIYKLPWTSNRGLYVRRPLVTSSHLRFSQGEDLLRTRSGEQKEHTPDVRRSVCRRTLSFHFKRWSKVKPNSILKALQQTTFQAKLVASTELWSQEPVWPFWPEGYVKI